MSIINQVIDSIIIDINICCNSIIHYTLYIVSYNLQSIKYLISNLKSRTLNNIQITLVSIIVFLN